MSPETIRTSAGVQMAFNLAMVLLALKRGDTMAFVAWVLVSVLLVWACIHARLLVIPF